MSPLQFLQTLTKSKTDVWIGGVCGGLGCHTPLPSWVCLPDEKARQPRRPAMTKATVASWVRVGAAMLMMAGLGSCKKRVESDAAGAADTAGPALSPDEPVSEAERAKRARAAAHESKEATKRALEFAQSASAAAKNAAAAAQRAAEAADAAVEAIRKIPPVPSATPAPGPRAEK